MCVCVYGGKIGKSHQKAQDVIFHLRKIRGRETRYLSPFFSHEQNFRTMRTINAMRTIMHTYAKKNKDGGRDGSQKSNEYPRNNFENISRSTKKYAPHTAKIKDDISATIIGFLPFIRQMANTPSQCMPK